MSRRSIYGFALLGGAFLLALLLQACRPLPFPWARPAQTPTAGPAPTSLPATSPTPGDLYIGTGDVAVYPGPERYSGDWLSFDVTLHNVGVIDPGSISVAVYQGRIDPSAVVASGVGGYPAFDGQPRARFIWAWNTAGLVGEVTLVAQVDPEDRLREGDEDPANNVLTFTVYLSPSATIPLPEAETRWLSRTTSCCTFHYLADTAAERDLPTITAVAEDAVAAVEQRLGASLNSPLRIYLLDRVIGHGGYAYDALALSYLDRHYAGVDLPTVLRHESTHVLDGQGLTVYPPAILREGLATWMAGGHFKPEPIPERAAALLELNRYIPLQLLAGDFYRQQHEIGYLEGAALVAYLVERHGWDSFWRFYCSFEASGNGAEMLDRALQRQYGLGLEGTEESFRQWLQAHGSTPAQVRDLEDTIALFDAVRGYQQRYDPGSYWLSGWLPDPAAGAQRGIVADFLRRPRDCENIALETMLSAAREELRREHFQRAEELIAAVNRVLDGGTFAERPAADFLDLVRLSASSGYEVQEILLGESIAEVQAIREWPLLEQLTFVRTSGRWIPLVGVAGQ